MTDEGAKVNGEGDMLMKLFFWKQTGEVPCSTN